MTTLTPEDLERIEQTLAECSDYQPRIWHGSGKKEKLARIGKEDAPRLIATVREMQRENLRLRQAFCRYLVPRRYEIPPGWRDFLAEQCGLKFSGIGYLEVDPNWKHPTEEGK